MESNSPDPYYSELVDLDLSTVVSCLAGPKRPQDRIELTEMKQRYNEVISTPINKGGYGFSGEEPEKAVRILLILPC